MTKNTNIASTPVWLPLASGTMRAVQHRRTPAYARHKMEDNPADEILGSPDPLPPMIDLRDEWPAQNGTEDIAFTLKRRERMGTTIQLLAALRLCATFESYHHATDMSISAALTVLDVGHPDWIQPAARALQDILPDHMLFYDPDEHKTGDLLILAPQPSENLGTQKDAVRFARNISDGLERETPMLLITAGHRALPDSIKRILPPSIRLAPVDADMVIAMLHLKFADGDARHHASLRDALPAPEMLARLGLDALLASFREADGMAIVETLSEQAAAMIPTDGPTLDDMTDESEAVTTARQIVADLQLWADGKLLWADCIHSVLFHGKPGVGKTHLAHAMGRSTGVPLILSSFARWQSGGHLGDMLKAMIETFDEAIAAAPCILVIDEIDSAGSRDSGEQRNAGYRRQVINGFLEQIDVAMRAEGVVIVGACNDLSALDPAILRPGRFDRIIEVPLPGGASISAIMTRQLGNEFIDTDLADIITAAVGSTPAIIDGAIRASRSHARALNRPLLASDVITCLTDGETPDRALMWRIAVHECGHAIMAVEQDLGFLRRVRLGPRDGHTALVHDLGAGLRRDHRDMLIYTLGGRAAESVVFNSVGSGSGGPAKTSDLAFATRCALAMETAYGFGVNGLIWSFSDTNDGIEDPVLRDAVQKTLNTAEAIAKRVLEDHRVLLLEMAKELMRKRILEGTDLQLWIDRITGDAPWDPDDPSGMRKAAQDATALECAEIVDLAARRNSL